MQARRGGSRGSPPDEHAPHFNPGTGDIVRNSTPEHAPRSRPRQTRVYTAAMRTRIGMVVLSLLFACKDDDADDGGIEVAEEDTPAAFRPIFGLARSAAEVAQRRYAAAPVVSVNVDMGFDCVDGGSVTISGTTATCADKAARGQYSLTVIADGCTAEGITIDGTLEHSAAADDAGLVTYAIHGMVNLDGSVEGSCAVDVEVVFPPGHGYALSGSLCGRDTHSLTITTGLLPPWTCPPADASGT